MSLKNPCSIVGSVANTGFECNKFLDADVAWILVPRSAKWSLQDIGDDFLAFLKAKFHAAAASRWFPIKRFYEIDPQEAAPQVITRQDGSQKTIRDGAYTINAKFEDGGQCMAAALLTFNHKNYSVIRIDGSDRVMWRQNDDGTYSGLRPNDMFFQKPQLATFQQEYANRVSVNIRPEEIIGKGVIFQSTQSLYDIAGLIDVEAVSVDTASTTKLYIGLKTECAETDLYTTHADALAKLTAWDFTKNGASNTPASIAKNDTKGCWEVTITGASNDVFTAKLKAPAALLALNPSVEGYECIKAVSITIP